MTTKTVTWIGDDLSPYESNGKTTYYVNLAFDDESTGSLGKRNQAKAAELRDMLVALRGVPAEFGLEDKNKPNKKGQPSYKIKSFPGYEPAPYQEEGGGKVAWRNTEEGFRAEQDAMNRRTALMQAVAYCAGEGHWADLADAMHNWLTTSPGPGYKEGSPGSGDSMSVPRSGGAVLAAMAAAPLEDRAERIGSGVGTDNPSGPGDAERRVLLEMVKDKHELKNDSSVLRLARGLGFKAASLDDLTNGDLADLAAKEGQQAWTP